MLRFRKRAPGDPGAEKRKDSGSSPAGSKGWSKVNDSSPAGSKGWSKAKVKDRIRSRHRKKKASPMDLDAADLHRLALRNMKIIALLGILLILADLGLSLTGESVQIVSKDGRLYLIRPAAGAEAEHVTLDATVRSGSDVYENRFDIRLDPQEEAEETGEKGSEDPKEDPEVSTEERIRGEFRAISSGFNSDLTQRLVPLPSRLESGEEIQWNRSRTSHAILLVALTAGLLILVYRSRLKPLQRQTELRQQSVKRQLPSFINELVLLLNAGLVLSRAFEVTVEQLETDDEDGDYFRRNLRRIYHSMKHTNGSLQEELQRFASDSGISELMRVSSIITDNINKGAELNRKLERESESLWLARKLHAEERGRLAETKMTLPLSIFLGVLIVITVSPALLQM